MQNLLNQINDAAKNYVILTAEISKAVFGVTLSKCKLIGRLING